MTNKKNSHAKGHSLLSTVGTRHPEAAVLGVDVLFQLGLGDELPGAARALQDVLVRVLAVHHCLVEPECVRRLKASVSR